MKNIFCALMMSGVVLFAGCGDKQAVAPLAVQPPQAKIVSLGFKPEQFQERFNAVATERKSEFRIVNAVLKNNSSEADQWIYEFTNRVGFAADVIKQTGLISKITYMGSGDGSIQSGANMMFGLGMMLRAIDPALQNDTANKLTFDLMDAVKQPQEITHTRNGVRYVAGSIKDMGFYVVITPAQ